MIVDKLATGAIFGMERYLPERVDLVHQRLRSYKQFAPTGAYADICLLKLGLALQNLKQYPEALAAFGEVRSAFAKSKYVAQATFEVGQCHGQVVAVDG